jgi:hypothetical protein
MTSINLQIKSKKPGWLTPIYLLYQTDEVKGKVETLFFIKPEYWDFQKQEPNYRYSNAGEYDDEKKAKLQLGLKELVNTVEQELRRLSREGKKITRESVMRTVYQFHGIPKPTRGEVFTEYLLGILRGLGHAGQ